MDFLKLLFHALKPYHKKLGIATAAIICGTGFNLLRPKLEGAALDLGVVQKDVGMLVFYTLLILGAFAMIQVCNTVKGWLLVKAGESFSLDMRKSLYLAMTRMTMSGWNTQKSGDLVNRMINEVPQVSAFVTETLPNILNNAMTLLFGILLMFSINVKIALAALAFQPLIFVVTKCFTPRVKQVTGEHLECVSGLNHTTEEVIDNIRIVKYKGSYSYIDQMIANSLELCKNTKLNLGKLNLWMSGILFLMQVVPVTFVFVYGGYCAIQGTVSFGDAVAMSSYIGYMIAPTVFFSRTTLDYQKIQLILERFYEIQAMEKEESGGQALSDIEMLEFRGLSFSYGEKQVFRHMNAVLKKGTVGLIRGRNGAGKTTLINLVCGLLKPEQPGQILVNGMAREKVDIRNILGIVTQNNMLFNDTVYHNICLGEDYTEQEIIALSEQLGFSSVTTGENLNLSTVLSKNGSNLSGGQAQKINILRALISNPKLVIFDEFDTFLDQESKEQVLRYMKTSCKDKIILVITHEDFQMPGAVDILL